MMQGAAINSAHQHGTYSVHLLLLQGFNIPSEGMWFWFEGMVDLFFYIDLVLNFFTAYEVRGRQL